MASPCKGCKSKSLVYTVREADDVGSRQDILLALDGFDGITRHLPLPQRHERHLSPNRANDDILPDSWAGECIRTVHAVVQLDMEDEAWRRMGGCQS